MSWRNHLESFISPNNNLHDVYQVGVFTGQSMVDIVKTFNKKEVQIRKFWGLDSFQGLPEERHEPAWQECWKKGNFDSRQHFETDNIELCQRKIEDMLRDHIDLDKIEWVVGFYEDTLNQRIDNMKPALYIDIDCDIYSATKTALDYFCRYDLIQPGTLIGFDDWYGVPNSLAERWQAGESKAFMEIIHKYRLNIKELAKIGGTFPHGQKIFQIV